jgi:hypothetical protein
MLRKKVGSKEQSSSCARLLPLKFKISVSARNSDMYAICYMAACKATASFPAREILVAASLFL